MLLLLLLAHAKLVSLFAMGVEASLLGILLVAQLTLLNRCLQTNSQFRDFLLFGFACAGVVLTRLDHLLFVLPAFGWLALQNRTAIPLTIRRLVAAALPGVVIVSAYLIVNYLWLGHIFPISGANKTFAFLTSSGTWQLNLPGELSSIALLLSGPVLLVLSILLRVVRPLLAPPAAIILFFAGSTVYSAFLMVALNEIAKWYLVSGALSVILFVGWILRDVRNQRAIRVVAVVLVFVTLHSHWSRYEIAANPFVSTRAVEELAKWAERGLDPDAVVAVCDAGEIAHVFPRHVFNADGLVNDWEYAESYKAGTAIETLKRRGATHMMTVFGHHIISIDTNTFRYTLRSPLGNFETNSDTFATNMILRTAEYDSDDLGGRRSAMILWTLD